MGVCKDIELGKGRDIAALAVSAAHKDQLVNTLRNIRRHDQRCREIGHRPCHHDRQALRPGGAKHVDQRVDGMRFGQRRFRRKRFKPGNPALAVEILRSDRRAHHWTRAPGIYGDLPAVHQVAHHARIPAGQMKRHVAGNGRDGTYVQI